MTLVPITLTTDYSESDYSSWVFTLVGASDCSDSPDLTKMYLNTKHHLKAENYGSGPFTVYEKTETMTVTGSASGTITSTQYAAYTYTSKSDLVTQLRGYMIVRY